MTYKITCRLQYVDSLHDQASVLACREGMISALENMGVEIVDAAEFLKDVETAEKLAIASGDEVVCFIGTGGAEEFFRKCFPVLQKNIAKDNAIVLLGDGYHNSFAASFEIATFLEQRRIY